ncbi:HNH endonuclease [Luteibacter aegosomatis]|uniref:HNH endonuclease n=1 Tax=Luteibacter aegosomatis TaxID=2911537 RepID=UPI001FFB8E8A|nr:HNH endonuclease signature motif containing protein [Luteibacter aegosomatis]UPG86002.1 HNH endonuclease [Luteibacter aegosomatis]
MKLNLPVRSFLQAIDACEEGITGNAVLLDALALAKNDLLGMEDVYSSAAANGGLHTLVAVDDEAGDELVVGGLRRSDLIKLYEQYFVPKKKPGRAVYNAILNGALEMCPFCGGIGIPKTLDHFLPKNKHPKYSVLPLNLVPSCRDCNLGEKGQSAALVDEDVFLQPYMDKSAFFDEQWIFAAYEGVEQGEPGRFRYFVQPPGTWTPTDVARAEHHFNSFELDRKYGLKAAQLLTTVLAQIRAIKSFGMGIDQVREVILTPGIESSPFPNHWQKGFYQALWDID